MISFINELVSYQKKKEKKKNCTISLFIIVYHLCWVECIDNHAVDFVKINY